MVTDGWRLVTGSSIYNEGCVSEELKDFCLENTASCELLAARSLLYKSLFQSMPVDFPTQFL